MAKGKKLNGVDCGRIQKCLPRHSERVHVAGFRVQSNHGPFAKKKLIAEGILGKWDVGPLNSRIQSKKGIWAGPNAP